MPKQQYIEQGLFTVREVPKGDRVYPVTAITGKGQLKIAAALGINTQAGMLELSTSKTTDI